MIIRTPDLAFNFLFVFPLATRWVVGGWREAVESSLDSLSLIDVIVFVQSIDVIRCI
jgi:hypothetical protein